MKIIIQRTDRAINFCESKQKKDIYEMAEELFNSFPEFEEIVINTQKQSNHE